MIEAKPRPPPKPEAKRLARRDAVTIVVGFKCAEGIVLCADTQETVHNLSKRNVPKLRVEPSNRASAVLSGLGDMAVAFCGATDNGPFVDEIIDRAWRAARGAKSLENVSELINQSIKASYREFAKVYQPGFLPTTELIYGVKMAGDSRLFYAYGPAVNEKDEYATGGIGYYMADFLASRMFSSALNMRQCVILAAYILFQAKEHVDGCGGASHIAVLRNNGSSGLVNSGRIEVLTRLLQYGDSSISKIALQHADVSLGSDEFRKSAIETIDALTRMREHGTEAYAESEKFWNAVLGMGVDEVGMPYMKEDRSAELFRRLNEDAEGR